VTHDLPWAPARILPTQPKSARQGGGIWQAVVAQRASPSKSSGRRHEAKLSYCCLAIFPLNGAIPKLDLAWPIGRT
jgi:hypothetical protein